MTATDERLNELHAAYIDGDLDRERYFRHVHAIHVAMATNLDTGPCRCLACRTVTEWNKSR